MKHLFVLALVAITSTCNAQQPTEKELQEMMKYYNEAMKDPNAKKALDSIQVNIPQLMKTSAAAKSGNQLPTKDPKRITQAKRTITSSAQLTAYLNEVHSAYLRQLPVEKRALFEQVYKHIQEVYPAGNAIGNAGCGAWLMGYSELSLYLLGRACQDLPQVSDNLNNYSAILTMKGGEQFALPILNRLNRQYPQNSTILNNIGQAWFGLGDLNTSEKYLDSTIRIYPKHPQAHRTKSAIEEAKGNKTKAIDELIKSMNAAYGSNKERELKKLGYKPEKSVQWTIPKPEDPLGLHHFQLPEYWFSLEDQQKHKPAWDSYQKELNNLSRKIRDKLSKAEGKAMEFWTARDKQIRQNPTPTVADAAKWGLSTTPYMIKAQNNLSALTEEASRKPILGSPIALDRMKQMEQELKRIQLEYNQKSEQLHDKYKDRFGEGKENPFAEECQDKKKLANEFLSKSNRAISEYRKEIETENRRWLNQFAYYSQFVASDVDFEVIKLQTQATFVGMLLTMVPKSVIPPCKEDEEDSPFTTKLPDFDVMNCNNKSSFRVPAIGVIWIECNKMTTQFDPFFVPINFKLTEDLNTGNIDRATVSVTVKAVKGNFNFKDGKFTNGSIDISQQFGVMSGSLGPMQLGVDAEVGVSLEFDGKGISDVVFTGDVTIDGKIKGIELDKSVEIAPGSMDKTITNEEMKSVAKQWSEAEKNGDTKTINEIKGKYGISDPQYVDLPLSDQSAEVTININSRYGINAGWSYETSGELTGMGTK